MPFALTSSTFTDGASVPRAHTCEGDDTSPPLTWSDPPAGTATFALVVDDQDAPGGVFTHWMLADIPATIGTLPAGATAGVAGTNGFSRIGYRGPCPPRGHGRHRYRFSLHALSHRLDLPHGFSRPALDAALHGAVLKTATLTAHYERPR